MEEYQDHSLGSRVFQKIRDNILNGTYKENDELRETAIGKELGVSRTPVREALRQLELEGLVTIIPNRGAYVSGISHKDIWDIYKIRSMLEGLCARWAAEHITEEQLPKLYESWQVVGTLKPEVAKELGFSEDVKVVAGAGDNAAAAVGTGTVGDGQCNISLGTSGTIFISSKEFGVDENNALHSFDHADGSYHLMGCMLSAASCNKWWSEEILQTKDFVAEQAPIQKLGENQVFFLPYLMGERSPHNNPDARGVFFGMSMDTTRADMTQAVLEGVAFGLRDSLEVARSLGISIERTKICGGGAKSPLWKKIIANVMNLKVDVPENEEGPSMGGAMLAAVGCGAYPDVETICKKMVKVVDTVEPDPELVAKYEEKYQKFRKLYPTMKELF